MNTETRDRIATATTLLFVPGNRPDRFAKAASSGADLVILDLEDAVALADKDEARAAADRWLADGNQAIVRINAPGTPWSAADVAMAARHGCPVIVPKAEDAATLADLVALSGARCGLIALVETALGVERAYEVCRAPGVVRAAFGNVDLSAQLGTAPDDHTALAYARSRLVVASAAAGIAPPVDGVTTALRDLDALRTDIGHARRLGFTAKLCIHPAQLPGAARGFAPSPEEVRWAASVLAAGDSATAIDGHMIDRPVLLRAERILAAAAETPAAP
ncbi:HpcH/HpaI aldolase/citrate lyase family protein [Yinghuangia soli]|uniref:CoA ester lyase n=1 Tax=Yinghuangia soli TaxID=2908204 RepID=A0AA41PZL3_9ACTN|nr:CoA ester lyase [Yinghuangia soli]MCF2528738.1 CoA ester lyase [Yinghuangia soli]